jgi:type IV secretion system protein VirB8
MPRKEKAMNKPMEPNSLAQSIAAMRGPIEDHEHTQLLLDLAADEADRRAVESDRSRRLAWRVAGAFGGLSLIAFTVAGGAVATALRPAPAPDVLVVDKASGVVQPLVSLAEFQMSPEEATIRRNVNTFVLSREGYSWEQADTHYYTTAAFLSPQLQAQWGRLWDKSNPESPPNKYKNMHRIRVHVGAITVLRNGLGAAIGARVSFTRTDLVNGVPDGDPTEWVANLSFHWVNQPASERDRRINDLGMEITDYTADRDLGVAKPALARQAPQQAGASTMAVVAPAGGQKVMP